LRAKQKSPGVATATSAVLLGNAAAGERPPQAGERRATELETKLKLTTFLEKDK